MSTPLSGAVQSPPASPSEAIVIRKISVADLKDALRLGWEDFKAVPTHAIMLALIYPVLGLVLAARHVGLFDPATPYFLWPPALRC